MNRIISFVAGLLIILSAKAQFTRSEAGVFGGVTYYLGDLNPSKQFFLAEPAFGALYRYNITPRWSFKLNGIYGTLKGNDVQSGANVKRNLSFKSHILDISAQIELNFLPYITGHDRFFISPYLFTGVSVFNFSPKANYQGKWYALQPLGTEGQGSTIANGNKPYSLTQIGIPFGIGIKYSLLKKFCIGAEWGMRKTFTDYLDDVSTVYPDPVILAAESGPIAAELSDRTYKEPGQVVNNTGLQRGNSSTKDWYSFAGIFITYKIKGKNTHCAAYKEHPKIKNKYSRE